VRRIENIEAVSMRSLKRWLVAPVESTLLQVPRALVASGLAAVVDMSVLVLLVQFCRMHPAPAAVLAYLPGTVLQYVLCRYWVFPGTGEAGNSFGTFLLFALVGLGITWGIVEALSGYLGVPYIASKIVALGVAFTWNFLSRKWILFRTQSRLEFELKAVPGTVRA
jgi:putative flippase GtrA